MYNLEDFEEYVDQQLQGLDVVLTWNRKDGYYFVQYGYLWPEAKVVAVMKKNG